MRSIVIVIAIVATGCGGSSTSGCKADEVEVDYLGGPRDNEVVCKPRPGTCDNPASCADNDCIAAMYGLCDSPYLGVGCSDTFAPPIISCNP
jgi:hypothetical protein